MEENYRIAFAEALYVISNSDEEIKSSIPRKFIKWLEEKADKNYNVNIDFNIENWEDYLKNETKEVLAIIYRKFLVSKEEREELLKEEESEEKRIKEELNVKYSYENLFKNNLNKEAQISTNNNTNQVSVLTYKESTFRKFINMMKNWFKKK